MTELYKEYSTRTVTTVLLEHQTCRTFLKDKGFHEKSLFSSMVALLENRDIFKAEFEKLSTGAGEMLTSIGLQAEVDHLKAALTEAETENAKLLDDRLKIGLERDGFKADSEMWEAEAGKLKAEDAQTPIQDLAESIALQGEIATLKTELDEAQAIIGTGKADRDELVNSLDQMKTMSAAGPWNRNLEEAEKDVNYLCRWETGTHRVAYIDLRSSGKWYDTVSGEFIGLAPISFAEINLPEPSPRHM